MTSLIQTAFHAVLLLLFIGLFLCWLSFSFLIFVVVVVVVVWMVLLLLLFVFAFPCKLSPWAWHRSCVFSQEMGPHLHLFSCRI